MKQVYRPIDGDGKSPPLARHFCIIANSGSLCRIYLVI